MTLKMPITLTFSMGATINIGNYESVRVQCGASVPVYNYGKYEEMKKQVSKFVKKWLETEVEEQVKKHKGASVTDQDSWFEVIDETVYEV